MARQSELTKEGREAALAENTLAMVYLSRDYMKSLIDKANRNSDRTLCSNSIIKM
jgi:hypothetical protein